MELSRQNGCVFSRHHVIGGEGKEILFKLVVRGLGGMRQRHLDVLQDRVGDVEVVGTAKGYGDVRDALINAIFGASFGHPVVAHVVGRVKVAVAVA